MAEFYKHEIAKWNVATDDLTLEQEAAYHRIVGLIRLYERPLRHNLRVLSGMWRCNERKAKRILGELIDAGKLTIEDGLIVDEKAVNDASILRQSRIDKQLAGSRGGIESAKVRRKSLENNDTGEARASTREEKRREENKDSGGDHTREAEKPTFREQILTACMVDPVSGLAGPNGRRIGTQADMYEASRWTDDLGLTEAECLAEIVAVVAAKRDGPPTSFRYFEKSMARLSAAKHAPPLHPDPTFQPRGQKPNERAAFNATIDAIADGLNSGSIKIDTSRSDPFRIIAGGNTAKG